jgi:hypothetical protein
MHVRPLTNITLCSNQVTLLGSFSPVKDVKRELLGVNSVTAGTPEIAVDTTQTSVSKRRITEVVSYCGNNISTNIDGAFSSRKETKTLQIERLS